MRTETLLVGLALLIKLALLALGVVAYLLVVHGTIGGPLDVLDIWNRWDTPHYLDVAVHGYMEYDPGITPTYSKTGDLDLFIVFYPLYPWLTGALNWIVHEPLVSALTVTTVASLFVAPLLYRLVRLDEGDAVALRAAWFLLIFPTAFFLHIGYTEALFLALALGSFLAARTERWWLAGMLGGLAALTRVNGLILIPALAAEAATQWFAQPSGERRLRPAWLAIGLVPVGFAVYLGVNLAVYHDAFAFLRIQDVHWFKSLAPPWDGIAVALEWFERGDPDVALMYGAMELVFVGLGAVATLHAMLRFRPSWFAWMAGNWILFISTAFIVSVPRYSLTLFPLFVSMALAARRTTVLLTLSVASIAGLAWLSARFATGAWAF
ncbi:MAG TPA: mannosyltransferase family protein [Candidatus Dormibacteraeota bacterium]|nr:mannosyltransferase family protein [Candidatus Dormibacteraeota bacterium]